jgi:hypothetical protein
MGKITHAGPGTLGIEARRLEDAARSKPVRKAFAVRAIKGITRLMGEMNDSALGEALSASSDVETIVRALENVDATHALMGDDLLAEARFRGLGKRDRLLHAEGGVLAAQDAAKHLGISRQAVNKRRKAGSLLGLSLGRRGYAYPAWQFGKVGVLQGLETVLATLSTLDPWMRAVFFLSPNPRLSENSPIKALRQGKVTEVVRAARSQGVHGSA